MGGLLELLMGSGVLRVDGDREEGKEGEEVIWLLTIT